MRGSFSPMTTLHIDFETRGTIELKDVGVDIYSRHPQTDVWCMAYALDDEDVDIVKPEEFHDAPTWIHGFKDYIAQGGTVMAHNASFELAIWNNIMVPRYGWPSLKPDQCRCTMAMAYSMALPGSLEKAAAAVGIAEQKDLAGGRLMLQMARPRGFGSDGKPVWWDEPAKLEKLYDYCRQDVRVERALEKRLLALSPFEQRLWTLDARINNRGVYVDRKAIVAAIAVVEHEQERLAARLREVSLGAVSQPSEVAALTRWIGTRGVDTSGLAKADVVDLLAKPDLPEDVRAALVIRQEAAKTSTAKLRAMLSAISHDGRIKNILQYHGAATGRWAGRRIQPQNMPRPKLEQQEIEEVLGFLVTLPTAAAIQRIELLYGSPMSVISDCLRGMITAAPGHDLIAADFSNIEGRVLAWLAGEEWKLQAFRDYDTIIGHDAKGKPIRKGHDIYNLSYGRAFKRDPASVTKDERQVGKVMELALGFGGGVGAFQTMARGYGVKIKDAEADVLKLRWREVHPRTVAFWYDLERAAMEAVRAPGTITQVRGIKYRMKGSFLFCRLPSGRMLSYPYPRICEVTTPWGEAKEALTFKAQLDATARKKAKVVDDPTNQGDWIRISTYGGSLGENVTQAVARDVLAEALERVEAHGYPVVMHVHDEAVAEVKSDSEPHALHNFEVLMRQNPMWAPDLPIAVESWRGRRYRK